MKFAFPMLLDFVETSLSAAQVGDLLTMAGFELEDIEQIEGDFVLDIKVCSNRGDGLSVFGLAREVLAKDKTSRPTELYKRAANRFIDLSVPASKAELVSIETDDCSRYAAMIFEGSMSGVTPDWISKRLRQAGIRSISLTVDLTNYVMLELGQPMHAFDFDKLQGQRIIVRGARAGEKLVTLDGNEHELQPGQVMICDASGPVAAGGVMGGLTSEVTAATRSILLESAAFVNTSVRKSRKHLGLNTEASYRFERSVDPDGVVAAQLRFAELLEAAGGPRAASLVDVYPRRPTDRQVALRMSRATRLLGMSIPPTEAAAYLTQLGMQLSGDGEPFSVQVPTWRPDIVREDDLVEELGRVHGYDKIPEVLPRGATTQGGVSGFEAFVDDIRNRLVRFGFVQAISHSFVAQHPLQAPCGGLIGPRNPGSPELPYLRNSLLPSLAEAAGRNGGQNLHIFETGRVFWKDAQARREAVQLAVLSTGSVPLPDWEKRQFPAATFFELKSMLVEIFRLENESVEPGTDPRLHPTRQGRYAGIVFGQLHPDAAEELGLRADTFVAEVDLRTRFESVQARQGYRSVSRNPAVRRDIAVQIDKSVPFQRIEAQLKSAAGQVLETHWLFDVYEGKGIPEGSHSLAIAMQFRKVGENFTDEEANQVRDRVVAALGELGATLR